MASAQIQGREVTGSMAGCPEWGGQEGGSRGGAKVKQSSGAPREQESVVSVQGEGKASARLSLLVLFGEPHETPCKERSRDGAELQRGWTPGPPQPAWGHTPASRELV